MMVGCTLVSGIIIVCLYSLQKEDSSIVLARKEVDKDDFNIPWGVAVDRFGNLYVSDYGNKRIVVT